MNPTPPWLFLVAAFFAPPSQPSETTLLPPAMPPSPIVLMTHDQAERYCADLGSRLPTARELAEAFDPGSTSDTEQEGTVPVYSRDELLFHHAIRDSHPPIPREWMAAYWAAEPGLHTPQSGPTYEVYFALPNYRGPGSIFASWQAAVRCVEE